MHKLFGVTTFFFSLYIFCSLCAVVVVVSVQVEHLPFPLLMSCSPLWTAQSNTRAMKRAQRTITHKLNECSSTWQRLFVILNRNCALSRTLPSNRSASAKLNWCRNIKHQHRVSKVRIHSHQSDLDWNRLKCGSASHLSNDHTKPTDWPIAGACPPACQIYIQNTCIKFMCKIHFPTKFKFHHKTYRFLFHFVWI